MTDSRPLMGLVVVALLALPVVSAVTTPTGTAPNNGTRAFISDDRDPDAGSLPPFVLSTLDDEIFEGDFAADETMVVYSGQGCHVYLLDTDREHHYDEQSREVINDLLLDEYGIPIDPVVTADRRRVMRLPYSLHADVSRVVQPIDDPGFDFRTEATPDFLDS